MKFFDLLWKELWLRKSQLISGLLAITLGIAVIVGIQTDADVSETAVKVSLDNLGANILVLPQASSVDDYYSADIDAPTFPEDYVEKIVTSSLPGVDNLSPKLTRRVTVDGVSIVLTGILPSNELASKPIWQAAGLVGGNLNASCDSSNVVNQSYGYQDEKLQRKAVDSLASNDVLVGSIVAQRLSLKEDTKFVIEGETFNIAKILPETGTIDDNRVFAHLHTVQDLLGIGSQISTIEIMGCCSAISDGLLGKLRNILPDTRITTINQIVSTQIQTNKLMAKISLIFLIIIVIVGSISIGNYMWANVEERKKEIGTLITLGATRSKIYALFFTKAILLGLFGGIIGFIVGSLSAIILGPYIANLNVQPIPIYLLWAIVVSIAISLIGSWFPTRKATRLEPAIIMQED